MNFTHQVLHHVTNLVLAKDSKKKGKPFSRTCFVDISYLSEASLRKKIGCRQHLKLPNFPKRQWRNICRCTRKLNPYSLPLETPKPYQFSHGLRTPNESINQRYMKSWVDVADKTSLGVGGNFRPWSEYNFLLWLSIVCAFSQLNL